MSLRSCIRCSSTISVHGLLAIGSTTAYSVIQKLHLSSSVSVRSAARMGSRLSTIDMCSLGSVYSLRGILRIGSGCSINGQVRVGGNVSILNRAVLSSSFSLRSGSRFSSLCSVFNSLHCGSSLSLRSFIRAASSCSIQGTSIVSNAYARCSAQGSTILGSSVSIRSTGRFAGHTGSCSVMDLLKIGSGISLRGYARCGSTYSISGLTTFARLSRTSIVHRTLCSSSLSIRSASRFSSGCSTLDTMCIGSSLSLRGLTRLGSGVSVFGSIKNGKLSIVNFANLGSCVSVRSASRFAGRVSVMNYMCIGSSMSIRGFVRLASELSAGGLVSSRLSVISTLPLASTLSVRNHARIARKCSILSYLALGSSVSTRSFVRFAGKSSIFNTLALGSTISFRSFVRIGSGLSCTNAVARVGGSLSIGAIELESLTNVQAVGADVDTSYTMLEIRHKDVGSKRVLKLAGKYGANAGGRFEGAWTTEAASISVDSDRNLKRSIVPLWKDLMQKVNIPSNDQSLNRKLQSIAEDENTRIDNSILGIIGKLNPVSFKLKDPVESKFNNFGFIAQEVQSIIPDLVETAEDTGLLSIRLTDFISVLALGLQAADRTLDAFNAEMDRFDHDVSSRSNELDISLNKLEESLLHNLITQALGDPKISIIPDADMIQLLGEKTAKWIFDGSTEGSVFQKWNGKGVTNSTSITNEVAVSRPPWEG